MNKKIEIKFIGFVLAFFVGVSTSFSQDITTVNTVNDQISDNLDLEAVASVFGDSKDLEDFEKKLNNPTTQISNLDLNEDRSVDYLRVVEITEKDVHVIAVQAIIGKDLYQDVATIEVEKDTDDNTQVQVVGDVYMYGPNYIINPVYIFRPVIFSVFWRPFYRPFRSVFYWGYYPRHFYFWQPHNTHVYRKNVHGYVNVRHTYIRTHVRRSNTAVSIHSKTRRNDFGKKYPNKSYSARVVEINKENGTKKRALAVNQNDGDKYRVGGVNKPNGTKKRAAGVNKPDGTKKRMAAVKKPDGTRKVVTSKRKPTKSKYKAKGKRGYKKGKRSANKAKGKGNSARKKIKEKN